MTAEQMVNQCLRKKVFRREALAAGVAEKWNRKAPPGDGKFFRAYYCPLCSWWHVGRSFPVADGGRKCETGEKKGNLNG